MPLPTRREIAGYFPRGYALSDEDWLRRHRIVLGVLIAHVPAILLFGLYLGWSLQASLLAAAVPAVCSALGRVLQDRRRLSSGLVTLGLVTCSAALVVLSHGTIEAHFHFFIIIGFIALYQDWIPFLLNIAFTVLSHGFGSALHGSMIFNHHAAQVSPWLWSLVHGLAVLFACTATMVFWRITEEQQQERLALAEELTALGRRRFTADLLVNLARRNQSMLHRQTDIINQLEESERDPDTLAELFVLDHLTTRVRRNSENLLVLSGETPSRMWSNPVPLRDVVRAAIAETEELERVTFTVDEHAAVLGHTVTDVTHLLAELTENAVRFSPPDSTVAICTRQDRQDLGGHVLTVEDCGVGMPDADLEAANELLADPPEVDLSVAHRLGFHVLARLAGRHRIRVTLCSTPGSGITAVVSMPSAMFAPPPAQAGPADGNGNAAEIIAAADRDGAAFDAAGETGGRNGHNGNRNRNDGNGNGLPNRAPGILSTGTTRPGFGHPGPGWTGWWEVDESAPAAPGATPSPAASPASGPAPFPPTSPAPAPAPAAPPAPAPRSSPQPPPPSPAGPLPIPAQRADEPPLDMPTTLRRRVPQTSLAPELRERGPMPEPTASLSGERAAEAAQALSRFQAQRDAARAESDSAPVVEAADDGARS